MARMELPFTPDMADAALCGYKACTSRNEKYGEVGDTFVIANKAIPGDRGLFKITDIEKRRLGFVAKFLYVPEGFRTPQGFIDKWKQIHPRKGFDADHEVWVHWFEEVE